MNPKVRKQVKIPTTVELHGIADKLGTDERTSRFRALVLLAGWCGMRFGEVTELRRRDFAADCTVVILPATAPSEATLAVAMKTGKTNQSGAWTSPTLAPGKYYALATRQPIDRSPETIGKLWKARNRGEEVDVAPNGQPSVILTPKPID